MKCLTKVLLLLGFFIQNVKAQKTITLAYENKANPPYYLGTGTKINWEKPGITLEVLREVSKRVGFKIKFRRTPWARGMKSIEYGRVDGIFHARYKLEREKLGVYPKKDGKLDDSRRILKQSYVLFKLKDNPVEFDGKAFKNRKGPIGVTIGYSIIKDLKNMGVPVSENISIKADFEKLLAKRISAVATLQNMGELFLKKDPERYKNVIEVPTALSASKAYFLLFSHQFYKGNKELAEKIWDAIREVRTGDVYKQISSKY